MLRMFMIPDFQGVKIVKIRGSVQDKPGLNRNVPVPFTDLTIPFTEFYLFLRLKT